MDFTQRRERFRAVLAGDRCIFPAPVFDAVSGRIAEDLGFEVGFVTPGVASEVVLGAPNLMVLTMGELVEQVRRICRASSISLLTGAEDGYGNALNVMRTVEELELAGVSALTIDAAVLPARFSSGTVQEENVRGISWHGDMEFQLTSLEEGVGKMKAALAARQDPSLVIVARTWMWRVGGIAEAIRRVKAYEAVGVDAVFLPVLRTADELEAIHAETRLPLMKGHLWNWQVEGEASPELSDEVFLASNGIRIASPGPLTVLSSFKAVYDTLKALHDGKSPDDLRPMLLSPELLAQVTRQSRYQDWIKNYLS